MLVITSYMFIPVIESAMLANTLRVDGTFSAPLLLIPNFKANPPRFFETNMIDI